MTLIEVQPIMVKPNGGEQHFGDETGTPQYYMVTETLHKHLGEDNVWVSWDYDAWTFIIEDEDEGCDMSYDYKRLIEAIYEPFPKTFYEGNYLKFEILHIE